jgi:hypothetical protein
LFAAISWAVLFPAPTRPGARGGPAGNAAGLAFAAFMGVVMYLAAAFFAGIWRRGHAWVGGAVAVTMVVVGTFGAYVLASMIP